MNWSERLEVRWGVKYRYNHNNNDITLHSWWRTSKRKNGRVKSTTRNWHEWTRRWRNWRRLRGRKYTIFSPFGDQVVWWRRRGRWGVEYGFQSKQRLNGQRWSDGREKETEKSFLMKNNISFLFRVAVVNPAPSPPCCLATRRFVFRKVFPRVHFLFYLFS